MNLINGKNDLYFTTSDHSYIFDVFEGKGKPWESHSTFVFPKCNKEELINFANKIIEMANKDK